MEGKQPLIAVGVFGVHVIEAKPGRFVFVGNVPDGLHGERYSTEDEAIDALISWVHGLGLKDRRECTVNARTDIFVRLMQEKALA